MGSFFTRFGAATWDSEQIVKRQDRYLRLLFLCPEVWLSNASAPNTGLAPSPERGMAARLMLINVLLGRCAGIPEDSRLFTILFT